MFFSRALLGTLSLVTYVSAQDARVAFTSVPAVVVGGESYNITWGGGDGSSVTITLRKGDPDDLDTVGILGDNVEGSSYVWDVSRSLQPADDYALQITQGRDQINYSGQFSLVEANTTTSAAAGATTSMPSNSTTTIGLGSNSTTTGNSTTSTSSLPRTITTTPATSARTPSASTSAGTASTASSASTAQATSAPDSNGAIRMTGSAAFVVGLIAAAVFLN